jgi:hypothetical protein
MIAQDRGPRGLGVPRRQVFVAGVKGQVFVRWVESNRSATLGMQRQETLAPNSARTI